VLHILGTHEEMGLQYTKDNEDQLGYERYSSQILQPISKYNHSETKNHSME